MTPLLIGIGHKARQGKTTLGEFLHSLRPSDSAVMHFGDSLKAVARIQHGMQKKDPTLLQTLADSIREKKPETFIEELRWRAHESGKKIILIPDVRYWNEAEWVKSNGGKLIRVRRLQYNGDVYVSNDRDSTHVSETDLELWPYWDLTIDATSVEELKEKALDSGLWRNIR